MHRTARTLILALVTLLLTGVVAVPAAAADERGVDLTTGGYFDPFTTTTVVEPRFTVEAVSFTAIDESGADWAGSDEVMTVWNTRHSDGSARFAGARTGIHGDVDSGDTVAFHQYQRCMVPISATVWRDFDDGYQCQPAGAAAPIHVDVELRESDYDLTPGEFCGGNGAGLTARFPDECDGSDDFLGDFERTWTEAELVAMLPTVGSSTTQTVRLNNCPAGYVCGDSWFGGLPDYDFTFTITRVPDVTHTVTTGPVISFN